MVSPLLLIAIAAIAGCTYDYEDVALGAGGAGADVSDAASGGARPASSSTSSANASSSSAASGGGCPAGNVCVPDASGASYVRVGAGAASCPSGWGPGAELADGVDPGCDACACGNAQSGGCTPGVLSGYGSSGCGSFLGTKTVQADLCANISDTFAALVADPPSAGAGACTPVAVSAVPLLMTTVCELGAIPIEECDGGGWCVPPGDAVFAQICISLPAATPCPPGWGSPAALAPVLADTRACGCSCGGASGASCVGASVQIFASEGCSGNAIATVTADGQCDSFQSNSGSVLYDDGAWTGGSCPPQPSVSGTVTFGTPITLCCAP